MVSAWRAWCVSPNMPGILCGHGIVPIVADITQPDMLDRLPPATTVLCSVGYDSRSETTRQQVYVDGLRAVLDHLTAELSRIILISSTGVYGSSDGTWVDEDSPCIPSRSSGTALLEAEQLLQSSRFKDRSVIQTGWQTLLAPEYAPPLHGCISSAKMSPCRWLHRSLCQPDPHRQCRDGCNACRKQPHAAGRIYNISDGHPVERREYLAEAIATARVAAADFLRTG